MSTKSERRARRQAINDLLAHQEPPSRLDQLDHEGKARKKTNSDVLQARVPAQQPNVPQQAGPSRSETTSSLAAHPK